MEQCEFVRCSAMLLACDLPPSHPQHLYSASVGGTRSTVQTVAGRFPSRCSGCTSLFDGADFVSPAVVQARWLLDAQVVRPTLLPRLRTRWWSSSLTQHHGLPAALPSIHGRTFPFPLLRLSLLILAGACPSLDGGPLSACLPVFPSVADHRKPDKDSPDGTSPVNSPRPLLLSRCSCAVPSASPPRLAAPSSLSRRAIHQTPPSRLHEPSSSRPLPLGQFLESSDPVASGHPSCIVVLPPVPFANRHKGFARPLPSLSLLFPHRPPPQTRRRPSRPAVPVRLVLAS